MRSFITQGGQRQFLFRCLDFLLYEWKQAWDSLSVSMSNKMLNKLQATICGKCGCSGSIEWNGRGFCSAKVQTSPLASTKESSTTFLESSPIPPRPILYLLLQSGKYCDRESCMGDINTWALASPRRRRESRRARIAGFCGTGTAAPTPQQYSECPQLMRKPVVQVQVGVDDVSFLTMQCSLILNDAVFQRKTLSSMFDIDVEKTHNIMLVVQTNDVFNIAISDFHFVQLWMEFLKHKTSCKTLMQCFGNIFPNTCS